MKPLTNMTRDDLIELVAAVFLRFWAFVWALEALPALGNWIMFKVEIQPSLAATVKLSNSVPHMLMTSFLFHAGCAALMFFYSVPLARLICRSLAQALERKGSI